MRIRAVKPRLGHISAGNAANHQSELKGKPKNVRALGFPLPRHPLLHGAGLLHASDAGDGRRPQQLDELLDRLYEREPHGLLMCVACGKLAVSPRGAF